MRSIRWGATVAAIVGSLWGASARAAELVTNEVAVSDAPAWLKRPSVEKVVQRVQRYLEWDIRRVPVRFYASQAEFGAVHGFGPAVLASTRRRDGSIHLGPRIDAANFEEVFGHELVHVVLVQKYKDAVPAWLEEGLANHVMMRGRVDYAALASARLPADVRVLGHPFKGTALELGRGEAAARLHYQLSQALIEMIASRCNLNELLQLSVGKGLERYLGTFCETPDVNAALRQWVARKGRARSGGR